MLYAVALNFYGGFMTQYYKIAGLTVAMDSFGRTVEQAKPYLAEFFDNPDIVICSNWQTLKQSQPHLSDEDCEYLMSGGSFYQQLLKFDGMLLHSSAVVKDGKAYLFTAPCGIGKSTHTKLWIENFKDAYILNDDKPALRLENGIFYAYGTPWSGKYDKSCNVGVPVAGICVLRRGKENKIEPYGGRKALYDMLEQTIRSKSSTLQGELLETLDKLMTNVPVWKMECNMEKEAAYLSYHTMSGGA